MVEASSHDTRIGSPGLPFTKLALFETIGSTTPLNRSWVRYSFIQAPDCLPGRA